MKKSVVVTARITPELNRKLIAYARAARRSKSQAIQNIIEYNIDEEMALVEAVLEGVRLAREEGTIPREEVMRRLRAESAKFRRTMRARERPRRRRS